MYRIGVTEAGDAGLDLSWVPKLSTVDGAVVITKKITEGFTTSVLANDDKLIVHATITGYGGSILEPNVPTSSEELKLAIRLVRLGFPVEKMVIRVDPVIPTIKGLRKAQDVILSAIDCGFRRFRVSMIDMYPHVIKRFESIGLPNPYAPSRYPSSAQRESMEDMLRFAKHYVQDEVRIECCAEPLKEAIQCGCVSAYDLQLLGLDVSNVDSAGYQRRDCLCYSGKTELLTHKHQCSNQCVYCYWY